MKTLSPSASLANKVEVHHLYPKNWLKTNGYAERRDYNQIANQTLVEWSVNAAISDRAPQEYGPEFTNRMSESDQRQDMDDHAMPARWWEMPYMEFLAARRVLMANVIRRSFDRLKFESHEFHRGGEL